MKSLDLLIPEAAVPIFGKPKLKTNLGFLGFVGFRRILRLENIEHYLTDIICLV
jgi:hypothetical protein